VVINLWVKIDPDLSPKSGNVTNYAVNTDTGSVIWIRHFNEEFRIEIELAVGVYSNDELARHIPLLGICFSKEAAEEKVDKLLTALKNGEKLFEI